MPLAQNAIEQAGSGNTIAMMKAENKRSAGKGKKEDVHAAKQREAFGEADHSSVSSEGIRAGLKMGHRGRWANNLPVPGGCAGSQSCCDEMGEACAGAWPLRVAQPQQRPPGRGGGEGGVPNNTCTRSPGGRLGCYLERGPSPCRHTLGSLRCPGRAACRRPPC